MAMINLKGVGLRFLVERFSQKILWLHVSKSNNDPLIIANFCLSCISKYNICPRTLRMDRGNENTYCEDQQVIFTENPESFIYGASIHNQQIESFWTRLKKFKTGWWFEYFKEMVKSSLYKENVETHQEALIFCFLSVLQCEFKIFMKTWNSRMIRQSANTPGGRPGMLFYVPSIAGFTYAGVKDDD